MAFASVTVTSEAAYGALVGTMLECTERGFGHDNVHGDDSDGRPIKFRGVGQPQAALHHAPRLVDPSTITVLDRTKLINYAKLWAQQFVSAFEAKKMTGHSVVLGNIVSGASADAELTAIRGEIAKIVTYWNTTAVQEALAGDSPVPAKFPSLPLPVALA